MFSNALQNVIAVGAIFEMISYSIQDPKNVLPASKTRITAEANLMTVKQESSLVKVTSY